MIDVSLVSYTGVTFIFGYVMKNRNTGEVVVTGQTEHCFTSVEGMPVIIKKRFPQLHEHFLKLIEK